MDCVGRLRSMGLDGRVATYIEQLSSMTEL